MNDALRFAGIPARRLAATLAIAAASAFLLFGYEFVRSVAQSLFVESYGTDKLPWIMAGAPVGTLLLVYGYGRLLSLTGPRLAILLSTAISAFAIIGCQRAILAGWAPATAVLYIFREGYIVLLVEQVWSFLNSTLTDAEGRKLNGLVCGIASLGPIAGGMVVSALAKSWGSANLLMLAALTLAPVGILAVASFHLAGEPAPAPGEGRGRHGHLGLGELAHIPMLRRMAILILLTQAVSTALELHMNVRVKAFIPDPDTRTAWFGGLYAMLNTGAAVFQFILTPLALRRLPLMVIHTAIPLVNMAAVAVSFVIPGLAPTAAAYMTFKVLDYSIFRAAKEILYIPLSFDARYRAKEVIDAFGYRLGKGVSSALFAAARGVQVIPLAVYPLAALAALAAWLPMARSMVRKAQGGAPHGAS
jgi:AAA family ATP:ADP antiporter